MKIIHRDIPTWLILFAVALTLGLIGVTTQIVHSQTPTPAEPTLPSLPPEKQLAVDSDENARRSAEANPPSPGVTKEPIGAAHTLAPLPTGIFMTTENQDKGYIYETSWNALIDEEQGRYLRVHTGHLANDPVRGVVAVDMWDLHEGFVAGEWSFTEPADDVGSIHILSADGHILSLEAQSGVTYLFDADARVLFDTDGEPVPTKTPIPTESPWPTPEGTPPFELPFPTETATPSPATATGVPVPSGLGGA
jgi:hypothetical protein